MVAKTEDGQNAQVPGLLINSKEDLRRFARSVERKLAIRQRDTKYESNDFEIEEYVAYLTNENVDQ